MLKRIYKTKILIRCNSVHASGQLIQKLKDLNLEMEDYLKTEIPTPDTSFYDALKNKEFQKVYLKLKEDIQKSQNLEEAGFNLIKLAQMDYFSWDLENCQKNLKEGIEKLKYFSIQNRMTLDVESIEKDYNFVQLLSILLKGIELTEKEKKGLYLDNATLPLSIVRGKVFENFQANVVSILKSRNTYESKRNLLQLERDSDALIEFLKECDQKYGIYSEEAIRVYVDLAMLTKNKNYIFDCITRIKNSNAKLLSETATCFFLLAELNLNENIQLSLNLLKSVQSFYKENDETLLQVNYLLLEIYNSLQKEDEIDKTIGLINDYHYKQLSKDQLYDLLKAKVEYRRGSFEKAIDSIVEIYQNPEDDNLKDLALLTLLNWSHAEKHKFEPLVSKNSPYYPIFDHIISKEKLERIKGAFSEQELDIQPFLTEKEFMIYKETNIAPKIDGLSILKNQLRYAPPEIKNAFSKLSIFGNSLEMSKESRELAVQIYDFIENK